MPRALDPTSVRRRRARARILLLLAPAAVALAFAVALLLLPRRNEAVPATSAASLSPAAAGPQRSDEPEETPRRMARLQAELDALVSRAPARAAAVWVQEIETGSTAGVHPDRPFLAASLIKLPVMAAAYALWERRPELKTSRALTWLEWMITISDNASTDRLIDLVGGPEVVLRFCADRGWEEFQVRHAILNHRGRRGLNLCTARSVVDFLAALDRRELVSPEADEEMWQVLLRQKKRMRIPAGLPELPEIEVGNKTGTLRRVLHDAAIVRTPRTRYALCILLSGHRSEAAGNRFCREVSRRVFERLDGSAETAPGPPSRGTEGP